MRTDSSSTRKEEANNMIYWINGAYGVGKTTVANLLKDKLNKAYIFDPELVGNAIRDNYPKEMFKETFEEYPLWLDTNYKLLSDIFNKYDGDIIVPMTLLKEESYLQIIKRLQDDGISVTYIFLDGDEQTLYHRMVELGREEPDGWCVKHIPICLAVQKKEKYAIHINTIDKTPDEIVDIILK